MRVTNEILKIINSITMDSILVITENGYCQDKYKIVKASDDSLGIVTVTDPNVFWNINTRSFKTVDEIKNHLVSDIALGYIEEIDVLNRRNQNE